MLDAHPAPDAHARPPLPDLAIDPPASPARPVAGDALFAAARSLLPTLEAGRPLDAATLRDAMTRAFGASDAEGGWVWKDAYEAAEAAVVLFVQRYGVRRRRQPRALPGGGRQTRRADREARRAPAGALGPRPDRAAFRARGGRRGDRPVAPGAEDRRCAPRAPGAALAPGVGQSRRDRRLHGSRQAHPGVLDGRRNGPQLPRRPLMRQHRAAHPLPAGARLARRPGDPGPRAHPPHAPGLGAALPPRRHRREGRATLHRHHRAETRQPGRDHARAARFPDRHGQRRPGALPRERQP